MIIEIAVLFALILVNGVLAMSELAVVSARPARLKLRAERGEAGAARALQLAADPGRFLSSVQIGITLVGVLAGAFSGATLGSRLSGALQGAGLGDAAADAIGVGAVVVAITYLSLIVGELVPKQLALRDPEAWATRLAPGLHALSLAAAPFVWLLDRSGKAVLAVLGQSGAVDRGVTDEEVRMVLSEARAAGVLEKAESEMITGVMRIADRSAKGLMVPRRDVDSVDVSDPVESVVRRFVETGRSRLPVRDGSPDLLIGLVMSRDFLAAEPGAPERPLRELVIPVPVVPDTLGMLDVLEALRAAPSHMVFVYDEYGHFEGLITPMDVLEGIAGEFPEDGEPEAKIVEREDGGLLVAGWTPVDEFAERIGLSLDPEREFETVAGLVLAQTDGLPDVGDHVTIQGWRIEVVDLDGRRIDKLLVEKSRAGGSRRVRRR
ncbi:MAG: hemolysin family protein [Oceanicaulis sp.]